MIDEHGHRIFRDACARVRTVVMTTHINPDGDAIGSQIGLGRFLRSRGIEVRIVNRDPRPATLDLLDDETLPLHQYDPAVHDAWLADADSILLLDNAAPDRMGSMERVMREQAGNVLCIDHHPERETPWAETIIDDRACATAAMVYELVRGAGWTPDPVAAEAIYVGLATDTGSFRFNSTNPRAHEIAAELLRLGAEPPKVHRAIYERNTLEFTRLLGHALSSVQTSHEGRVLSVSLALDTVRGLGATDVDTSEISTALLAVDGIDVALLFRELDGGSVKVSLRSRGRVDVHRLASEFGGGGHRNASGIVMPGGLESARDQVADRISSYLEGS